MELQNTPSVAAFTAALASSAPTPGGGGATALCGSLSAALCAMASRLTAGKAKYADRAEELNDIVERCDALRESLLALIDEDAKNFAPLAAAYALPKDDPQQAETLRLASLNACRAPLCMLRCVSEAVELLERARALSSPLLLSDVGCGAALAKAALLCAAMNVRVNTRSLKDDGEAKLYEEEVSRTLAAVLPRAEAVCASVLHWLEET